MTGQPFVCAGVGAAKARVNQARVSGEKAASESTCPAYRDGLVCRLQVMELYQAEWCPHSHRVRQRLTELGLDVRLRQVPAEKNDRLALERATGTREIP